ncbi:MAG: RNA-binding cell elongation regulator Jag/EloR [Desulfococcaceae bacterium]
MSSCLEFEGKVVEKALQKASEALNIPKDKIKYNVVSYGSSGIFGLVGAKKAKICVTLPPDKSKSKSKTDSRPDKKSVPSPAAPAAAESTSASAPAEPSEGTSSEPAYRSASALVREAFDLPPESVETDEDVAPPEVEPAEPEPEVEPSTEPSTPVSEPKEADAAEALALGKEALQRIIDLITTDAEIHVENNGDRYLLNVQGGNPGVLIGKKGQTLEAIQYLVEKIVNRHSDKRIRIQVDVEGYLENRRSNLRSLAKRLADKTKQNGKPSTLGQMNAHDRRIVHLTLKDDTEIRTQSIGEGFYRKLVIFPKKKKKRS